MKLTALHEGIAEWAKSSEALAALAEYLREEGFYVESLLPWRASFGRQGHYLSILSNDPNHNVRVIVSLEANSLKAGVYCWGRVKKEGGVYFDLSDPDSFPAIAAKTRELFEP